eukprot:SAG11_NODE_13250_length_663_cov_0.847518_1_plen_107_part_00
MPTHRDIEAWRLRIQREIRDDPDEITLDATTKESRAALFQAEPQDYEELDRRAKVKEDATKVPEVSVCGACGEDLNLDFPTSPPAVPTAPCTKHPGFPNTVALKQS